MPRRTLPQRLPEEERIGGRTSVPPSGRASEVQVPPDLVDLGIIRGAYGVKGWARLALPGSDGSVLQQAASWWLRRADYAVPVEQQGFRRHGAAWLAKWAGCDTPEQAEALKGAKLAVPRSAFPPAQEGQWYWVDLLGSTVVNRQAEVLGEVVGLRENAGGQWLEVRAAGADDVMLIPMVDQYVESVDTQRRRVQVDWVPDWS